MAHIRSDLIWLTVLVTGLGSLAALNLGRGLPYLLKGEIGLGVTAVLILGVTAATLALSALIKWVAVLKSLLK